MDKAKFLRLLSFYGIAVGVVFVILLATWSISNMAIRGHGMPLFLVFVITLIGALVLFAIFFAIGLGMAVYHDAKRRNMDAIVWALVSVLVPYFLGLITYLVVRQPIQEACKSCGALVKGNDTFCNQCGHPVQPPCPNCKLPLAVGSRFCSHCGTRIE